MQSMINLGCDIVYMPRLLKHINNEAWLKRILTSKEYAQFLELKLEKQKLEYFAGRFAAKEAYSKAMKTGIGKTDFKDFEVLKASDGRPVSDLAEVSISHDNDYAMAVVIVYEKV